jgi:hypothetical protein
LFEAIAALVHPPVVERAACHAGGGPPSVAERSPPYCNGIACGHKMIELRETRALKSNCCFEYAL